MHFSDLNIKKFEDIEVEVRTNNRFIIGGAN